MVRPKCAVFSFLFLALSASIGFSQAGFITTYAGPGLPVMGEPAVSQHISCGTTVALDGTGGFYIPSFSENRVYRVDANGKVSLAAGNGNPGYSGDGRSAALAQLYSPWGVTVDGAGNLYVADYLNNRIRKVAAAGAISTVAGNGTQGFSGDGGLATAAQLNHPRYITVDSAGNLYISDVFNARVRKVTPNGVISTVAGSGTGGFGGDGGPATAAKLLNPNGLAVDSAGNLYIADTNNYRVRKVTSGGVISTVAGNGTSGYSGDNGPSTAARLNSPYDVAVDSSGNLYIADTNNYRIRKVTTDGTINTVAGNGSMGYNGDGQPATAATLWSPYGMAIDSTGNLYIAENSNNRIRKVTAGMIATVAGNGLTGFSGDGGPATAARVSNPTGVAHDSAGNLYITGNYYHRIRKVTADGIITAVAGTGTKGYGGDGGPATSAQLNNPYSIAIDSAGSLYIADYGNYRVRKVTAGVITTVAGNGSMGYSGDGGPATAAQLAGPEGMAVDSAGNLYIADYDDCRIRKVTAAGMISTVAGNGSCGYSGDGGRAMAAMLYSPAAVAVDSAGNLYIADSANNRIRKVTTAGMISTVAGTGVSGYSGDTMPATVAQLNNPSGVSVDSENNLYISDTKNNRIRKITADGTIRTIIGNGINGFSGDNGPATMAQLWLPNGVAIDPADNLYVADAFNNRVRKVANLDCASLTLSSGGASACQTAGTGASGRTGYAKLEVDSGAAPYGTGVFSFKQSGVTVTEAGVPSSPPTIQARIFIDYRKSISAIPGRSESGAIDINTGMSLVNLGSATANVGYTLRALNGNTIATGQGTIAKGNHSACFIDQMQQITGGHFGLPYGFERNTQFGTLEISSDQPLSVIALRMTKNQRGEFLYTTTPIADMTKTLTNDPVYFPQFADGGGYTTSLVLVNTSSQTETGKLDIFDSAGVPFLVSQVGGSPNSSFPYSIPAGGAFYFQSDGLPASAMVGWARIVADAGSMTPIGSGVFGFNPGGVLVSESGVPSAVPTTHARIYADLSGSHNTGLAIANIGSSSGYIVIRAFLLDGASEVGYSQAPLLLAGNSHDAKFANQYINGLPEGFKGVLDISSAIPFAALTTRFLYNERYDSLMTTFPTADANQAAPSPIVFPHIADGGGYATEFIMIGGGAAANITPGFYDETGAATSFGH
jgi:trimeric autotransporter adhesin